MGLGWKFGEEKKNIYPRSHTGTNLWVGWSETVIAVKTHGSVSWKESRFVGKAGEHPWTKFASGFMSERETLLRSKKRHESSCFPCYLPVSVHLWDILTVFCGWKLKERGRNLCISTVMKSLWCLQAVWVMLKLRRKYLGVPRGKRQHVPKWVASLLH